MQMKHLSELDDIYLTKYRDYMGKYIRRTYYGNVASAFDTVDGLICFIFNVSMLGNKMHASFGSLV